MSIRTILQRHRLIISKLRRGPCTFEQFDDFIKLESEIQGEDLSCSQRTFQRDINDIASLYNIIIKNDPSLKAYKLVEDGEETNKERLIEAFEIFNAMNMANNLSEQVILEKRKPLGTENLHDLLHAIKNRKQVSFAYEKFSDEGKSKRVVNPVAIKESRNRWYLLAQEKKKVKSFGLERISNLEITGTRFPQFEYDPEGAYRYSFGIDNGSEDKPERIVLSCTPKAGRYIKSLPLHHSQEILLENEDEIQIAYFLLPTYDFIMEIISHGDGIKVLEPKRVQKIVKGRLQAALDRYTDK